MATTYLTDVKPFKTS